MIVKIINGSTTESFTTGDVLGSGETARVYKSQSKELGNVAIKVSRDASFDSFIEIEYSVLTTLIEQGSEGTRYLPHNILFGQTEHGRKAIIMQPVLEKSVLNLVRQISNMVERDRFILRAAQQYVSLLKSISAINKNCQDKKLLDFWWTGDLVNGHLVVTDWNVINDVSNQLLDIRRFGLLWHELSIGNQPQQGTTLNREEYSVVKTKISYGLWYLLGRCLGPGMGRQITNVDELAQTINKLIALYDKNFDSLIQEGRINLKTAQDNLDRDKADYSWICLDLAEKISGKNVQEIESAQTWATNPAGQYASTLLEELASPVYSIDKILNQLSELSLRAHGHQEKGDIDRLRYAVDFFEMAKEAFARNGSADRATMRDQFLVFQKSLVKIITFLSSQNIFECQPFVENVQSLISFSPNLPQKFKAISNEALFWDLYNSVQENETDESFLMLKELRSSISYLGDKYEPTLVVIEEKRNATQAKRRIQHLQGELQLEKKPVDRYYLNKLPLHISASASQWQETVAEILHLRKIYPYDSSIEKDFMDVLRELVNENKRLKNERNTPQVLSQREEILNFLIRINKEFPEFGELGNLEREYQDNLALKATIIQAQKKFFSDPIRVLTQAQDEGYEIFDVPGLSVSTLKLLHEIGHWEKEKFDQELKIIEEKARQFQQIISMLNPKVNELEGLLENYRVWNTEQQESSNHFFFKALRLYLASAWANLETEESAEENITKAKSVLDLLKFLTDNIEYKRYEDFYEFLIEQKKKKQEISTIKTLDQKVQAQPADEEFNRWFQEHNFNAIAENYPKLQDQRKRAYWEKIVSEKALFSNAKGVVDDLNKYSKRGHIEILIKILENLMQLAENQDGLYRDLHYRDEIDEYYARAWSYLDKLNKNTATKYPKNLGVKSI